MPEKSRTKLTEKLPSLAFESLGFDMIDGTGLSGIYTDIPMLVVRYFSLETMLSEWRRGHVLIRHLKIIPNIIQFDYRGYGNSGGEPRC